MTLGNAAFSASTASSYVYVDYCTDAWVPAGTNCPTGGKYGGFDKNFYDYDGTGNVYGLEFAYNDTTNPGYNDSQRDPYNVPHFNSVGDLCADWYAGDKLSLYVGNVEYSHHIYGSGRYEVGDEGCP